MRRLAFEMLTDVELTALLRSRESVRVERKASFHSGKAKETACAFANDMSNSGLPGVIFFGVNDDGSCAHLQVSDQLLLQIGDIRADGSLQPPPIIEVEERVLDGCPTIVLQIHPHNAPPVRYSGRTWIRVGPRNQMASPEEERILSERRRFNDAPFDYRPVSSASLTDMDEFRFRERYLPGAVSRDVIAQNGRDIREQMISLRLLDPSGIPSAGGLLIAGKDPERFIPGAYIQYVRFEGLALTDPIVDEKRLSGTLDEQLSSLDDLIRLSIKSEVDFSGDREVRRSDYPVAAIQQLARNAVMHRNYQSNSPTKIYWFTNRVEIQNPGGLFGHVNAGNFGTGVTDYRNPLVAEGMKGYGFAQRFGVGIQIAKKLLLENGNPEPEFLFSDVGIVAIVLGR